MSDVIKLMAFKPNPEYKTKIYYVGFPEAWKEKIYLLEKSVKPNFRDDYNFNTYMLKDNIIAWLDGVVEVGVIKKNTNDDLWLKSCTEVDVPILFELIKTWISGLYINKQNTNIETKELAQELLDLMKVEDLNQLTSCKEKITLFDSHSIPMTTDAFSVFRLNVINSLVGKKINLNGVDLTLLNCGKNELITEAREYKGQYYSFVLNFSLQTTPPDRESLLLCQTSIRRWISKSYKNDKAPYLGNDIKAYVKVDEFKLQPVEMGYYFNKVSWNDEDIKFYHLFHINELPDVLKIFNDPIKYIKTEKPRIYLPYKNGYYWAKHNVGPGVSLIDKAEIKENLEKLLSGYIINVDEEIERKDSRKFHYKNTIMEDGKKPEEYETALEQVKKAIDSEILNFEIYYSSKDVRIKDLIKNEIENRFMFASNILTVRVEDFELGNLADNLEESDKHQKNNIYGFQKRVEEVERKIKKVKVPTACIIILNNRKTNDNDDGYKEPFDPKYALRIGFAKTGRLTQFITPERFEKEGKHKIKMALLDLLRQLGVLYPIKNKKDELISSVTGVHIFNYNNTYFSKTLPFPIFVTTDFKQGKVFVESSLFEKGKCLYWKACLQLAKLSIDFDLEQKIKDISQKELKQKLIELSYLHKDDDKKNLIIVDSNGISRKVWPAISDSELSQIDYFDDYVIQNIKIGTSTTDGTFLDLTNNKLRIIRIRTNEEVPDYCTIIKDNGKATVTQGIFKFNKVYWSIDKRPGDKNYRNNNGKSKISSPNTNVAENRMIEIYPIRLHKEDNPDDFANYIHNLRDMSIQYNEKTIYPLPLHLAKKLEEYIFYK